MPSWWGGATMTNTESVDIVDAINLIHPQLDFLSVVLSYVNIEINGKCACGLSLILARISEELQAAIKCHLRLKVNPPS
jgi:hypothetical protein